MNGVVELLNQWGAVFSHWMLSLGWQTSLFILALLVLDWGLRRYVQAIVRYGLWMLLLVKLMLPPSFSLPVGVGHWIAKTAGPSPVWPTDYRTEKVTSIVPLFIAGEPLAALHSTQSGIGRSDTTHHTILQPAVYLNWAAATFLLWLLGVVVFMVLIGRRARVIMRLRAQAQTASSPIQEALDDCRRVLGMKRLVDAKVSSQITSPAVCGLWHPMVLIPAHLPGQLTAPQLRTVLLHELGHIQRWDVEVNYLQAILQIIYFYQPLLWLANARIRLVREQAVDELVLIALGQEPHIYAETLVRVARFSLAKPNLALGLPGIAESKSTLTVRIKHILNRPLPKTWRLGWGTVAMICILGITLLPMAKAEKGAVPTPTMAIEKTDDEPGKSQPFRNNDSLQAENQTESESKLALENLKRVVGKSFLLEGQLALAHQMLKDGKSLDTIPLVVNDELSRALKMQLAASQGELADLRRRYQDAYPLVVAKRHDIESLRNTIAATATNIIEMQKREAQTLRRTITMLEEVQLIYDEKWARLKAKTMNLASIDGTSVLRTNQEPATTTTKPASPQMNADNAVFVPNDIAKITIVEDRTFNGEYKVRDTGTFPFLLVGEIKVAGRTPQEVAAELKGRLEKDFLVKATVKVELLKK